MFILEYPKHNIGFPVYGNAGKLGSIINNISNIIPEDSTLNILKNSFNKQPEYLLKNKDFFENMNIKDRVSFFEKINIRDKSSFTNLYDQCFIMESFVQKNVEKVRQENPQELADCIRDCFFHSEVFFQKYFELIGYWTRKMEERVQRKPSGKGQKYAKEKRVNELTESIKEFVEDHIDGFHIDKGQFYTMLCKVFKGSENYPRQYKTFTTYKKDVEQKLGKKIILEKKRK